MHKYMKGGSKDDQGRLFPIMTRARTSAQTETQDVPSEHQAIGNAFLL